MPERIAPVLESLRIPAICEAITGGEVFAYPRQISDSRSHEHVFGVGCLWFPCGTIVAVSNRYGGRATVAALRTTIKIAVFSPRSFAPYNSTLRE